MVRTVRRFAFPVTHRTTAAPTHASGLTTRGATTDEEVLMFHHPASGEQLERLPEGVEAKNVHQGYTPAAVAVGVEGGAPPSEIVSSGVVFEVVEVSPWPAGRLGSVTWRQCLLKQVVRT